MGHTSITDYFLFEISNLKLVRNFLITLSSSEIYYEIHIASKLEWQNYYSFGDEISTSSNAYIRYYKSLAEHTYNTAFLV